MKKMANSLVPRESRPERVGPRVTALRETLALSKAELADSIGLDRSTLTKVEKGQTGLDIPTRRSSDLAVTCRTYLKSTDPGFWSRW